MAVGRGVRNETRKWARGQIGRDGVSLGRVSSPPCSQWGGRGSDPFLEMPPGDKGEMVGQLSSR